MPAATITDITQLPAMLTRRDLIAFLGFSPCKVKSLTEQPDFPALRIGHRIRIPKDQFLQWLEQQRTVSSGA